MPETVFSDNATAKADINYWENKLQGSTPLGLPADFTRPTSKARGDTGIVNATVEGALYRQIFENCDKYQIKPPVFLLTIFQALLYRYTDKDDILLWSILPLLGDDGRTILLPVRNIVNGNQIFTDLLEKVNEEIEKGLDCSEAPAAGNSSSFLSIDVLFAYGNGAGNVLAQEASTRAELKLTVQNTGESFKLDFEYDKSLFKEDTISRMSGHYQQLLKAATNDPEKRIGSLQMLTPEEWQSIIADFNNTLTPYASEKNLAQLFEEQAERTPDAIALLQHEGSMTYNELNEKANILAWRLIENGVSTGDNIGLIAARGFDMIVGMYGIMKAGGAYVPIDPEYPLERQQYILSNSSVTRVVADNDYPLQNSVNPEVFVNLHSTDLNGVRKDNPGIKIDSKQLAYTIYTSGSTGRPKGVMIEHHSAVNLVQWVNKQFNICGDDRLLFITSMCFDLSVYDIFGMLAAGGSIAVVKQEEVMDVAKLKDMMLKYGITFWDSVPTTMDYLVRELENHDSDYLQPSLRIVFMSGDWIPVNLPGRIKKFFPNADVISLGGATEGTIWSNFYPVKQAGKDWSSIPYGRPIDNNFFYILNEQLQPAPLGVAGELYIGGVGVARGYANDPDKTNYSFVSDPFNDKAGGRMYRTGDLGRMLPDMNMEFIGRKDDQVKIRGFRIELGEIESVLKQCGAVRDVVVLAKNDKEGKKRLISYIVPSEHYKRDEVIAFLKTKVPDYMVPSLWMELAKLPLTTNGKVDKKALPDFEAEIQLKETYAAPQTESEKLLADIWSQVLKIGQVGVQDNFFDIGGHSLLAVQIMSRIEKKTGKKFPIATLFRFPTIASLGAFLDEEEEKDYHWRSLVPIKPSGHKTPVYLVHGIGMNVLNFNDLASYVDTEQPVYGFQGLGLDGAGNPPASIEEIASFYVNELLKHNPKGPYAVAGYSIGGFIAVEMARQLLAQGRQIKMFGIFDTDAENARENEPWHIIIPKVVKRYLPRFMGGEKSLRKQLAYVIRTRTEAIGDKVGIAKQAESKLYYALLNELIGRYQSALDNYTIKPVGAKVHLFKAKINVHYNDDKEYLGWKKFAKNGVELLAVPGDHLDMLKMPNAAVFGRILQNALDND
ncbi:MAG: amino acid adenylation domain-containing protein [Bacteroidetes bacterium]|nr:amino acid adenylation domain-containing protein [Bacteroidota bacterium]